MPRIPKLTPVRSKWAAANQWSVSLPAHISTTGKRQRTFFKTKTDAENFCETTRTRIRNFGVKGSSILPPSQQEQAANALQMLAPFRISLNEVVTDWISRRQAAEASVTFEDAMDAFVEWGRRSPSYVRSIRQTRNRLTALHGKKLNTLTTEDLTRALDSMTGSVRNFTIRILGGLFNWGIKRGYCSDNPCKRLDLALRDSSEIEIYTPAQVAAILATAEKHEPQLVPYLAITFFCGVRRSEALRLDWSAIDLHESFVKLPAAITKTRKGRHIDITENCRAWIAPYAKELGSVTPFSENVVRKHERELRSMCDLPAVKHGARHSFASYWLAQHGDINQLCRFLGHDDPETTFKHYAKAATKREAEKFWAILPKAGKAKNVVAFRRASA